MAAARALLGQCQRANVPVWFKQFGAHINGDPREFPTAIHDDGDGHRTFRLRDRAGADPSEWPEWARIQQLPK